MSEPPVDLVHMLAAGGDRALGIADAISLLVKDGAELGALEVYQVADAEAHGGRRECRRVPQIWLERLGRAAERGAFERMTIKQIVDRILLPPLPEAPEKT